MPVILDSCAARSKRANVPSTKGWSLSYLTLDDNGGLPITLLRASPETGTLGLARGLLSGH